VSIVAYIGLGANLGDPAAALRSALDALDRMPDSHLELASSFYRSAPMGHADQPEFVNAVARLRTARAARALLGDLQDIEARAGRSRSFPNAPRTLDLDLLLYGDAVIDEPGLAVPHPRMHERRFVLEPLVEICPGCVIPGRGPATGNLALVAGQQVERIAAS
jgi:2-amino-4-hydroxy-6-hydroxymethyldihydropteridine diphosphokinase